MKNRIMLIALALLGVGVLIGIAGCTAAQTAATQKYAGEVQAVTTQPVTEAVVSTIPYGSVVNGLVGLLAGAVVTYAPMFAKQKTTEAAVVEVAQDTATSVSDAPFSAPTQAILAKHNVDTPGTAAVQAAKSTT